MVQSENQRIGILIQARLSSSRLPGKMLMNLGGIALVEYVYKRCLQSEEVDCVAVITSTEKSDNELVDFCRKKKIPVFRGPLNNVLQRYVDASLFFSVDTVVRVCGDSPFVDIYLLDNLLREKVNYEYDFVSIENTLDGFLFEIVTVNTLNLIRDASLLDEDLEHVTLYIKKNLTKFQCKFYDADLRPTKLKRTSLTIDTIDDLILANRIIEKGISGVDFTSQEVIDVLLVGC